MQNYKALALKEARYDWRMFEIVNLAFTSRRDGVQELPVAKPGVQRRIANLTEAPKECSSSSNSEVISADDSRISARSSSDLEEGLMMCNGADFTVGSLEDGNIPTFLMDQLGPSTTTTATTPPISQTEIRAGNSKFGGSDQMIPAEPQVRMNFTITSDDIVEMKIEPDVILAGADTAVSADEKKRAGHSNFTSGVTIENDEKKKRRSFPEGDFKMKLDKQRATEESNNHCVPPKKRKHDLTADGSDGSGKDDKKG